MAEEAWSKNGFTVRIGYRNPVVAAATDAGNAMIMYASIYPQRYFSSFGGVVDQI